MIDSSVVIRAAYQELIALDQERARDKRPIGFTELRDGGIYIHRAYQSWMKVIRNGKELPDAAILAAVHMAGACLKYAADLGVPVAIRKHAETINLDLRPAKKPAKLEL